MLKKLLLVLSVGLSIWGSQNSKKNILDSVLIFKVPEIKKIISDYLPDKALYQIQSSFSFPGHVTACAISPDSKHVALASMHVINVFDLNLKKLASSFDLAWQYKREYCADRDMCPYINGLVYSTDNKYLYCTGQARFVQWQASLSYVNMVTGQMSSFSLPLKSGTRTNYAGHVVDCNEPCYPLAITQAPAGQLAIYADNNNFMQYAPDDFFKYSTLFSLTKHDDGDDIVGSFAYSPNGKYISTGMHHRYKKRNSKISIVSASWPRSNTIVDIGETSSIKSITYSLDNRFLAAGVETGVIKLWCPKTYTHLLTIMKPELIENEPIGELVSCQFLADGRLAACYQSKNKEKAVLIFYEVELPAELEYEERATNCIIC